ncbi:hypothetical protein AKJ09_03121 [Labilithrix luteola]|uniref:Gram-positive cocci surface proteins LPxTG domain-containing protein n=1 Tax=Labilithrix luteola TaxID=1391654 RepID=A0A0K1PSF8_9BACT|nr:hypothetical protein [Labilithrix luteola]AKU96457.1 hypothetical protein AKJ09_03121 [Labilithrix luteola]
MIRRTTLAAFALTCLLGIVTENAARADVPAGGPMSDGQSRFVYGAAIAGLLTGGIVAYYRSKKSPPK